MMPDPTTIDASHPILVMEDDPDDRYLLSTVVKELLIENPVLFFSTPAQLLTYLSTGEPDPLLIFCTANLNQDGALELKRNIDQNPRLKEKSIPFVFLSTAGRPDFIEKAYGQMSIQGLFVKPDSIEEFKRLSGLVFQYWRVCLKPGNS